MNKISKKIVSLVTMAAFVLTLVPAAAFAADDITIEKQTANSVNVSFDAAYADVTVHVQQVGADDELTLDMYNSNGTGSSLGKTGTSVGSVVGGYDYRITNLPAGTIDVWVTSEDVQVADAQIYVAGDVSYDVSGIIADDEAEVNEDKQVVVDPDTTLELTFDVKDTKGTTLQNIPLNSLAGAEYVYIWAQDSNGQLSDAVTFEGDNIAYATNDRVASLVKPDAPTNNAEVVTGDTVTAYFERPGVYTIVAGVASANPVAYADGQKATDAFAGKNLFQLGQKVTVKINNRVAVSDHFEFALPSDVTTADGSMIQNATNDWTYEITDGVTPNGVKVYTVEGTAYQKNGTVAAYETLSINCNRNGINILNPEVGTDMNGEFEFSFQVTKNGSYPVVVLESEDGAKATLTIEVDEVIPTNIKTIEDGGYLLAGNDPTYKNQVDFDSVTGDYMVDAVQFEVTDAAGKVVENKPISSSDYELTVDAPKDSDLKAGELSLVWNPAHEVYTLAYNGNSTTKDLIPGEYTVKIAFNNSSKSATATFNLAQFGEITDLVLDMTAKGGNAASAQDNAIVAIDDQVALGQTVTVIPKYVDENGIKVKANLADIKLAVNGDAVASRDLAKGEFTIAPNYPANESLIGTVVTVKAFDENDANTKAKYAEVPLTIVKAYLNETLSFDPTEGPVDEDNTVTVSVVDEDGNLSKVNGDIYASITDQSNADADVDLEVADDVTNGKGEITLYSNAETTADVLVVVRADNGEMYGATLTYTFGAVDPVAENTVVMSIGSTDYVVNNDIIKGDAAPYVDAQWRTMVPFRVLGETFGAEVNWDQDTQTVTYTYGDTELTMTIGEETYTVNGTEKTMDTAPVLSGDRTYVPVRFVGEALGYTVTALYDTETGVTAAVVFQK